MDDCFGKASSLSYVTILSVVPVAILVFALFSSYESTKEIFIDVVDNAVIPYLFPGGDKFVAGHLVDFSNNAYTLSILGIIFLFVAAVDIMFILESSVNSIWRVKKGRSIIHNIIIYWVILTLGPLFLIVSFYVTSQYAKLFFFGQEFSTFIFPLLVTWVGFFISFLFLPHTKVSPFAALVGALIVGTIWEIGKFAFGFYMTEVANETYGRIYGPLYIIPIFIFWIYLSYAIFLYGVQLSYLVQYPELFRQRKVKGFDINNFILFFILNALYIVYDNFQNGNGGVTLSELAYHNKLSRLEMDGIMILLTDSNLVQEVSAHANKEYLPIRPMEQIEVLDIVNLIQLNDQICLKRGNPIVEQMFNIVLTKIDLSKRNEFDQLSFNDLLNNHAAITLSDAAKIG